MPDQNVKIVVFVPKSHSDVVRQAMGEAGGGHIGNYTFCSFSIDGTDRFKPGEQAHPVIGEIGKIEQVAEERVECVCSRADARQVINAVRQVHPYEEVAFDIYPLISEDEL